MKSKEALREIVTSTLKYLPDNVIDKISKLSNIVLKDLERLEELELNLDGKKYQLSSENESLKNRVEDLEKCYKVLLKENQELKVKADKYDSAQRIVLSTKGIDVMMKLQTENEKLTKAIEIILKYEINLLKIKQFSYEGYVGYCNYVNLLIPTQQEYDLLKEVLGE